VTCGLGVVAFGVATSLPVAALSVTHASTPRFRLSLVASGLTYPTFAGAPKGQPGYLYVTEQPGVIRVIVNGKLRARPFLDIRSRVKSDHDVKGLLSMAFHPDYVHNHLFYVDYTDRNGDTAVVRYRSNGSSGLPGTATKLLSVHEPYANHYGGQLEFGPDGRLYVSVGDGGSGGDPDNRAQDLSQRLGKLLRLNVNKAGAKWQVVGYGLRNPWRFSWDRVTHDLYIADVGQENWEEVDVRTPVQQKTLNNYGWSVWEGRSRYKPNVSANTTGALVSPLVVYKHEQGRCAVTGGYVYRGKAVPAARGRYFYSDFCSGDIWSLRTSKGKLVDNRHEKLHKVLLSSFGEDSAGELYLVSLQGRIFRLER